MAWSKFIFGPILSCRAPLMMYSTGSSTVSTFTVGIDHLVQRRDQRRALAASGRTGQDDDALGLRDGLVEEILRRPLQTELVQIRDDLPVVEHADDDALELVPELDADDRHDRDAEADHGDRRSSAG